MENGQRFGRLTLIEGGRDSQRHEVWRCRCDCGKVVTKQAYHLLSGAIQSCGCLARESRRERALAFWREVRQRQRVVPVAAWGAVAASGDSASQ